MHWHATPSTVELRLQPSMKILIIFPEDTITAGTEQQPPVRHGGDVLEGYLNVTTSSIFTFEIAVSFEGVVRTWQSPDHQAFADTSMMTAQYQLLKERQMVSSDSSIPAPRLCNNQYVYCIKFQFLIPKQLISPRSDVHIDFLGLSPSVKIGSILQERLGGKKFMQPMIYYVVKATLVASTDPTRPMRACQDEREVEIVPQISAAPPLSLEEYTGEYRPEVTTVLKRHMWSRPLGQFHISAREPLPLNNSTANPRASTTAFIKLHFNACRAYELKASPFDWEFVADCYIRSRIFYSTEPLNQPPTVTMVKTNPSLRMFSRSTMSESRQCSTLPWRLDPISQKGIINSNDHVRPWTTILTIPVNAPKTLLPSFLNPLSACRHTLVVRIGIAGLYHNTMRLELPIQVVYDPLQGAHPGAERETAVNVELDPLMSNGHLSERVAALAIDSEPNSIQDESPSPPAYFRY